MVVIRVIKTNVTWSFCFKHNVNIRFNTSVTSIKTNARKNFFTPKVPPLQLATKNKSGHCKMATKKSQSNLTTTKI